MTSNIERQVMAGVATIYTVRMLFSRTALELYALAASALALWQLTWVHHVFENFFIEEHYGIGSVSNYALNAVEHTHFAVQLTLFVAALALVGLIADAVRSLSTAREFSF